MNMKKTIAAIAATSVAVSAMATTVSAATSKTLHYNLVSEVKVTDSTKNPTDTVVTVTQTGLVVPLTDVKTIKISVAGMMVDSDTVKDVITVSGYYTDNNKSISPINITGDFWAEEWNQAGAALITSTGTRDIYDVWSGNVEDGGAGKNTVVTAEIPVVDIGDGTKTSIEAYNAINMTVKVKYKYLDTVRYSEQAKVNLGVNAQNLGIKVDTVLKEGAVTSDSYTAVYSTGYDGRVTIDTTSTTKYEATEDVVINATAAKQTVTLGSGNTGNIFVESKANDNTNTSGITVTYDTTAAAWKDSAGTAVTLGDYGVVVTGSPADGDILNIAYTGGSYSPVLPEGVEEAVAPTVDGTITIKKNSGAVDFSTDRFVGGASSYTKGQLKRAPFQTGEVPIDIISYLENNPVNDTASAKNKKEWELAGFSGTYGDYVNVRAVLNDAVQNYETVTFTFNTATSGVEEGVYYSQNYGNGVSLSGNGVYSADSWKAGDNTNGYTEKYMAFGEGLYTWNYENEGTTMTGYDWSGKNLFTGALVVNGTYTMSLSDTAKFDWSRTSISFDWDAILDEAATQNDYATYIHTLGLATSSNWYWDSMDVVLEAGEADDVSADAGVEGDDETLDDEGGEDIDLDDEGEEPADVEPEPEPEPAPVTEAPVAANPTTGNASVALAVIPVALAAAAVVAKKRS